MVVPRRFILSVRKKSHVDLQVFGDGPDGPPLFGVENTIRSALALIHP